MDGLIDRQRGKQTGIMIDWLTDVLGDRDE